VTTGSQLGPLVFSEKYFNRIWGGTRLASEYRKPVPPGNRVGEAWLISDHASCESTVEHGEHAGKTLHQLLTEMPAAVLGSHATLTRGGRFPLLLKLLDTADVLSVQVHPNDATAARMGESDSGKTEMWYVMNADSGSKVYVGLDSALDRTRVKPLLESGSIERHLETFVLKTGDTVFVPAGTVHAIGPGFVLAEVQQNSDITYRLYDWNRVDDVGRPRDLHIDQGVESIRFGEKHRGPGRPLAIPCKEGERLMLAACRYFAAEQLRPAGKMFRSTKHTSFHIVLAVDHPCTIVCDSGRATISSGQTALVAACEGDYELYSDGTVLEYYVPRLEEDVFEPLVNSGCRKDFVSRIVWDAAG
jgi:mannose-6-phosphate isomerase